MGRQSQEKESDERLANTLSFPNVFSYSLTKGRSSDGFFLNVEDLVRQAIKEFDYPECTIFRQLVQIVAPIEKVRFSTLRSVLFFTLLNVNSDVLNSSFSRTEGKMQEEFLHFSAKRLFL